MKRVSSHSDGLNLALEQAKLAAEEGEVPVGAVVVLQGEVIALGRNDRETNKDPLGHAEIHAIKAASSKVGDWRLEGCTLYVTLEPCPMCLSACQQARVERVVYGAKDPKGGALCLGLSLHQDPRTNHRFDVDFYPVEECGSILTEFFRARRKDVSP